MKSILWKLSTRLATVAFFKALRSVLVASAFAIHVLPRSFSSSSRIRAKTATMARVVFRPFSVSLSLFVLFSFLFRRSKYFLREHVWFMQHPQLEVRHISRRWSVLCVAGGFWNASLSPPWRDPAGLTVEISRELSTWINFSSRVIKYRVPPVERYFSPGEIARLRVYERFTVARRKYLTSSLCFSIERFLLFLPFLLSNFYCRTKANTLALILFLKSAKHLFRIFRMYLRN